MGSPDRKFVRKGEHYSSPVSGRSEGRAEQAIRLAANETARG
jgi:hypothetical protein